MKLICAGMTDVGRAREHNEDDFYLSDGQEALCIVADGMGGHRSGEVASAMAIKAIVEYYRETMTDIDFESEAGDGQTESEVIQHRLKQAVQAANKSVFKAASQSELYRGMGTTIVAGFFAEDQVFLANIGDSRAYRFREGELSQCTEDHSLANEYVRMGILSDEEVEYFPYKNVITRACGLTDYVEVDIYSEDLEAGDIYLFCTDGLTDMVRDDMVAELIQESGDLEQTCQSLVSRANENGGADNVTLILAQIVE